MKNLSLGIFFALALLNSGCQMNNTVEPDPITICPPASQIIGRDTIRSGQYMGITLQGEAKDTYTQVQALRDSKGVSYLNVVGNITSDLSKLNNRIPLYTYILLDEQRGTDSGVQINLEADLVKSIYLNSGKALTQWPEKANQASSIRIGDHAGTLYEKLVRIREKGDYSRKFEYISLATKNLSALYDPVMAQSRQWYFAYSVSAGLMDYVAINFIQGKVDHIEVVHYKL